MKQYPYNDIEMNNKEPFRSVQAGQPIDRLTGFIASKITVAQV